jgi:hypothetical protein
MISAIPAWPRAYSTSCTPSAGRARPRLPNRSSNRRSYCAVKRPRRAPDEPAARCERVTMAHPVRSYPRTSQGDGEIGRPASFFVRAVRLHAATARESRRTVRLEPPKILVSQNSRSPDLPVKNQGLASTCGQGRTRSTSCRSPDHACPGKCDESLGAAYEHVPASSPMISSTSLHSSPVS